MTDKLPTAMQVRQVLGQIRIGDCIVAFHDTTVGRDRFPWRVYAPDSDEEDMTILVDLFATYREAVRCAKMVEAGTWDE